MSENCNKLKLLIIATVFFCIVLGFSIRTLVTHDVVSRDYFVYLPYVPGQNRTSDPEKIVEHPAIMCILAGLTYMVLALVNTTKVRNFDLVYVIIDGIMVAYLSCVICNISELFDIFNLCVIYTAFHVFIFWTVLNHTLEFKHMNIARWIVVLLGGTFWFNLGAMLVVTDQQYGVTQFFANCVIFLDIINVDTFWNVPYIEDDNFRKSVIEEIVKNLTRMILLICVYVQTE